MKIYLTLIFILTFGMQINGQNKNKTEPTVKSDRIENIEKMIIESKFKQEKDEIILNSFKEKTNTHFKTMEENFNIQLESINSKLNDYLSFVTLLVLFIGFILTFFGAKIIKGLVTSFIEKKADGYTKENIEELLIKYIEDGKIERIINEKAEPFIEDITNCLKEQADEKINEISKETKEAANNWLNNLVAPADAQKQQAKSKNNEISKDKISRIVELFKLAYSVKKPKISISFYEKILKIDSKNVPTLNNIATMYMKLSDYDRAIEYLTECIFNSSDYYLPYQNRGISYFKKEEYKMALQDIETSIKCNSNNDYLYFLKASTLSKIGDSQAAIELMKDKEVKFQESARFFHNRGYFYLTEIKDFEKAESDYLLSKKLGFPNLSNAYNSLAVVYRKKKEFKKAHFYTKKAKEEDPNNNLVSGTIALIYADQKDTENFYKYIIKAFDEGCPVWNFLDDEAFDNYKNEDKFKLLLESYKSISDKE